jgi:hypothetical protein
MLCPWSFVPAIIFRSGCHATQVELSLCQPPVPHLLLMDLFPHPGYPFLWRSWLSVSMETILELLFDALGISLWNLAHWQGGVGKYEGVHLPIGIRIGGHVYYGANCMNLIEQSIYLGAINHGNYGPTVLSSVETTR